VSPRRSGADTREHVLEVAHELFYWRGIRATGVDAVAAEAGVAPTTLYRLFASKDDLVAAYVERASRLYREWFDAAAVGTGPRERILAVFDALAVQVRPENCRGCPFLMALTEFPEEHVAAHRHAVAVKFWVRRRFAELGAPDDLADDLALVMEGVYASVQALGVTGPARRGRRLAQALLDDRGLASSPG
jgi:AcrR family transcriptional regulator